MMARIPSWLVTTGLGVLAFLAIIGMFAIGTLLRDGELARDPEPCQRALAEANEMLRYGRDLSDRWDSQIAADGFYRVSERYLDFAEDCREIL